MVFQQRPHIGQRHVRLVSVRHLEDDFRHGAFQLADVRAGTLGDVRLYVGGHSERHGAFLFLVFADKAFHDAQFRFDFRRLDVERAAGIETRFVTFVDVDVLRRAVGRQDNLPSLAGQLVEDLEHDVERLLFALQVLHVVHQQNVGVFV